jgi:hypothetical protein
LARPVWHAGLLAPPVFRDGRRLISLIKLCGFILSLPIPLTHVADVLEERVRLERIRSNGRREPWRPNNAWIRRFLASPYSQWIPSISWHPEKLRPDGHLLPGWNVVGWPEQLIFNDWSKNEG